MISVSNLSHSIGRADILSDISITFPVGKVTALIGPNGAGKSTLLNLIARQEKPHHGQVSLEGQDIWATNLQQMAKKMAMVAQSVGVASRLRVRDLVAFGRWPHHHGRPGPDDTAVVANAMEVFELDMLAERFLDEISGGQRQRAFVAMAYCQDTDWLLLDEPLNNLDLRYATALMGKLNTLAAQGKGIVIVLHDLNYAVTWSDRIVAMRNGRVLHAGPTKDVATSAIFSDVFGTEVTVDWETQSPFVRYYGTRTG